MPQLGSKKSLVLPHAPSLATTALTFSNANSTPDEIQPLASVATEEPGADDDTEDLQSILHSYIRKDRSPSSGDEVPLATMNLAGCENVPNGQFLQRYVVLSRLDQHETFHHKFKHFFVLSNAGKPIYSLNGADKVTVGFMGLITALVSSVEETMDRQLHHIRYGPLQIVVINREPLILVAVSRLYHENKTHLALQLEYIYSYLLSILSRPAIVRSYHNRMNYDLRKVLTALDFQNLDGICTQLSYGQIVDPAPETGPFSGSCGLELFTSHLLGSALPSIRITNTVRKKLNGVLQASRKIREPETRSVLSLSKHDDVVSDLLFGLLVAPPNKIIALARPTNHHLSHRDISILTYIVSSVTSDANSSSEDLWVPVCMPDFNSNGFLYAFIKKFDLASYVVVDGKNVPPQPVQIVLLSSNKNTFDSMQTIASNILNEITWSELLRCGLSDDLATSTHFPTGVDHFVFRLVKHNQFISSDMARWSASGTPAASLQLTKFLSTLHKAKSDPIGDPESPDKKLTYLKWNYGDWSVTGLRLSDTSYEFYSLCNHSIASQDLINTSMAIIKWCRNNIRRLTLEEAIF